ncbi:hypothetical protein D3C75_1009040 [compost metagenome]
MLGSGVWTDGAAGISGIAPKLVSISTPGILFSRPIRPFRASPSSAKGDRLVSAQMKPSQIALAVVVTASSWSSQATNCAP